MTEKLFESSLLQQWHKEMNAIENVPPKGFRRDVGVYPLVGYVNNIICCYLSKNEKPIPIFIARARVHMELYPASDDLQAYYRRVREYLGLMEQHLIENGVDVSTVYD